MRAKICAVTLCLCLAGCSEGTIPAASTAPASEQEIVYAAARTAAENGQFDTAITQYETLLQQIRRGKDAAELRLEYALVLLYADAPDRALAVLSEARQADRSRATTGEAAVLEALALHRQTEQYLDTRPRYIAARNRARDMYAQMVATYDKYAAFDESGIIPLRLAQLREDLAEIELREMRADLSRGDRATASQRAQYIRIEFGDTVIVNERADELQRVVLQQA